MKERFGLLIILVFLSGCGTMITVPIDRTPLSESDATVIVFHEQGLRNEFVVFLDGEPIGTVTSETPLKISVTPGDHELHTEVIGAIDRVTRQYFEAGKTYFMRIWFEGGFWVNSIRVDPTHERDSYEVRSHRQ